MASSLIINEHVWQELLKEGCRKDYKEGELLYLQDDPSCGIFCLLKGKVKNSIFFRNGNETIFRVSQPRAIIGEISTLDGGLNVCSATAVTEVETVCLPTNKFWRILDHYPELSHYLLVSICGKLRALAMQTENLSGMNISVRTSRTLLNIQHYGKFGNEWGEKVYITHQELASLVGSTRSNITTILNELARKGMIQIKRGEIIILDREKLEKYSYPDQ